MRNFAGFCPGIVPARESRGLARISECEYLPGRFFAAALMAVFAALLTLGCGTSSAQQAPKKFELRTTTFRPGGDIPRKCTCDGGDVSPALAWSDPPPGTKSFALIVDDPDAPSGTFTHWVVYDLAPTTRQLPEKLAGNDDLRDGAHQGVNDFPMIGYGGPCPPPGKPHRYFFKLYALDTKLGLKREARKQDVEQAMQGHTLAQAELMGKYKR